MIILDRYEGDFAFIEIDGKIKKEPVSRLKSRVKEGSVLTVKDGMYIPDAAATAIRRKQIAALSDELFS